MPDLIALALSAECIARRKEHDGLADSHGRARMRGRQDKDRTLKGNLQISTGVKPLLAMTLLGL